MKKLLFITVLFGTFMSSAQVTCDSLMVHYTIENDTITCGDTAIVSLNINPKDLLTVNGIDFEYKLAAFGNDTILDVDYQFYNPPTSYNEFCGSVPVCGSPIIGYFDLNDFGSYNAAVLNNIGCDISDQAYNAQQFGADLIVIVNDNNLLEEFIGGAYNNQVTIPVISVKNSDSLVLFNMLNQSIAGSLTCGTAGGIGHFYNTESIVTWNTDPLDVENISVNTYGIHINTTEYVPFTVSNPNTCNTSMTDSVLIYVNEDVNYNIDVSSSQQLYTATPFAVQFDNNTVNFANYNFSYDFGDGQPLVSSNNATVFHQYGFNGTYTVNVYAEHIVSGCIDTLTLDDYIFCTGGNSCNHASIINQSSPISACLTDSVYLSTDYTANYTYQWRLNGGNLSAETDTIYYPTQTGNYSLVAMDANGCPKFSTAIFVEIYNTPSVPTINSVGNLNLCGGSMNLAVNQPYTTYHWSNGAVTDNILINTSGNYSVTVTNADGCSADNSILINGAVISPPEICVVGVDSISNKNKIVWEKTLSLEIDSFNIYKEVNQIDNYSLIGTVSYNDLAVFIDTTSNPEVQAEKYKITIIDTCGVETLLSDYHQTIHLTINQGVGTIWNLIWSDYHGITFPSYNIYRGTNPSNMTLLTTVTGSNSSYTDISAPTGNVYYKVEGILPSSCDPTKSSEVLTTSSNLAFNGVSGTIDLDNLNFTLYPNPTTGVVKLESNFKIERVKIISMTGVQVFETTEINSIDISHLSKGIYLSVVETQNGKQIYKRIVKN